MSLREDTFEPRSTAHVALLKADGNIRLDYDAQVGAPFAEPEPRDLGCARLEHRDLFTESYWRSRWYSVKEIRRHDGQRKGWYCDITRPAVVRDRTVISVDLYLDMWVSADLNVVLRLDKDEFAASGLAESDPSAASRARAALDEVERLSSDGFAAIEVPETMRSWCVLADGARRARGNRRGSGTLSQPDGSGARLEAQKR